jgi:hypothetical protein
LGVIAGREPTDTLMHLPSSWVVIQGFDAQ